MELDAEQARILEEWIATRPPRVAAVIRKYPPDCYRVRKEDSLSGHYLLYSFEEPEDDAAPVTVKILHGRDSFMPGMLVFGHPPEDLVRCGCGKWEMPSQEEADATFEVAVTIGPALRAARQGH